MLVVVRALWIFGLAYVPRVLGGRQRSPVRLADAIVLSWSGMRGVVSLAAALALPSRCPTAGRCPRARR